MCSSDLGSPLFFPFISSGLGNGALVECVDGSVKYDFISGIGSHFSHSHPSLIEASLNGIVQDTVMQGHLQQSQSSASLLNLFLKTSGMAHGVLTSSGVMAVENGLKLAFQKRAPAQRVLAFQGCFMGRTLAAASITDKPALRVGLPTTLQVDYIPFFSYKRPKKSLDRAVRKLKQVLKRYPNQHACMCFELIQGEAGYYSGTSLFFKTIMTVLKEAGIPVFVDEIQTFGRTSHLYAYQHFELEEYVDIVSVGKLSQVCATLFTREMKPKPGLISQTFTSSSAAIESSKWIVNELLTGGYLGGRGKNQTISRYFRSRLVTLSKRHPHLIQGPFGKGLMIAFTVFNGEKDRTISFCRYLFEKGVMSFIAGEEPCRIRFLVPIGGVKKEDIDNVLAILLDALQTFKPE